MSWKRDEYGREYDDQLYKKGTQFGMSMGFILGIIACLVIGLLIPW